MSTPVNGDALIADIQPTLRRIRTQVCLRPELMDEWNDITDRIGEAERELGSNRLNPPETSPEIEALRRRADELEAEMDRTSPWFEFEALPYPAYEALCADHPPRDGDQLDLYAGHDRDAVAAALVRKCLVDPVFSDAGWEKFLTTCAPSEWAELRNTAIEVNGVSLKPPKSRRVSLDLAGLGNESASPDLSVSHPASSTDELSVKSTSTSTTTTSEPDTPSSPASPNGPMTTANVP